MPVTPFTDTRAHTRRVRLAALLAEFDGYESDEWSDASERFDDTPPQRFALVESNQGGSSPRYWLTFHTTADRAANYHVHQEYAADWGAEAIVDLDTGQLYEIERNPRAVPVDAYQGDYTQRRAER